MKPLWGFASLHIQTFDVILYPYILNRYILFCISTYSIVLCCSVFLHIQSFYVYAFLHIQSFYVYAFLHIQSFYDALYIYIFNYVVLYYYIVNSFMFCILTY